MPIFQSSRSQPPIILTKDKDRILAYLLSPDGAKQLKAAGIRTGATVPARVLASLIRSGLAHSPHPADAAGQTRFDFSDDDTASFLPHCELTGTSGDVHLVVYGEAQGTVAKLLSREPRFLLQKVTSVSVPVGILSNAALNILEVSGKLPGATAAAARVRHWLRQDLDTAWEKLRQSHDQRQADLPLDATPDHLPLSP